MKKPAKKSASRTMQPRSAKTRKSARKYGSLAQTKVGRAMHELKQGTLRSGRSKKKVTSRKQAVAIGLSEARAAGAKVPKRKAARRGMS